MFLWSEKKATRLIGGGIWDIWEAVRRQPLESSGNCAVTSGKA